MASQGKAPWHSLCFTCRISDLQAIRLYYHSFKYGCVYVWADLKYFVFIRCFSSLTSTKAFHMKADSFLIIASYSHGPTSFLSLCLLCICLDFTPVFVSHTYHMLIHKCLVSPAVCAACAARRLCLLTVCLCSSTSSSAQFKSCPYLRRILNSHCNETRQPIGRRH